MRPTARAQAPGHRRVLVRAGRPGRALLALSLLTPVAVPVVLALPLPGAGSAAPRPVPPLVSTLAVRPEPGSTLRLAAGETGTGPRSTSPYRAVGVTWTGTGSPARVEVRTRTARGWTGWRPLDAEPDREETPGAPTGRAGTDLLWTDRSDGVDVRVRGAGGRLPASLRVELIDPGTSPADPGRRPGGTAYAAATSPAVVTRAEWGADESLRRCGASYSDTVKAVVVHHTASGNDYTAADAPAVVRSIYAYHVKSRGWCDVGYNVLVDRYGVAYEGRAGGLDRPVAGAHAGGFNSDTAGISIIGDFTTAVPPLAARETVARWTAWKLGLHHRDPLATTTLTSAGGGTAKYPSGRRVELPVILGHRDVGETTCPGQETYVRLPGLRDAVAAQLGAALVDPAASSRSVETGSGPVTVTAGATGALRWQLDVLAPAPTAEPGATPTAPSGSTPTSDAAATGTPGDTDGPLVRRWTGAVDRGVPLSQAWDLTDASGTPVAPGSYRLRLSAAEGDAHARPWEATLEVRAPGTAPAPTATPTATPTGTPTASPTGTPTATPTATPTRTPTTTPTKPPAPGSTAAPSSSRSPTPAPVQTASTPGGSGTTAVVPLRVLDTRRGTGGRSTPLGAGQSVAFPVLGRGGVPASGVDAVVLSLVGNATTATDLVAHRTGAVPQRATTLALAARGTAQVLTTVPVASDGTVTVRSTTGTAHAAADVVGYASRGGDAYTPVSAARVLDTRATGGAIAARADRTLRLTGRAGVPSGARAVLVDLTLVGAAGPTHLSVSPSGGPRTGAWAVSTPVPDTAVAGRVLARLGSDGAVVITAGAARTHVLVDVVGWYGPGAASRLRPVDPVRLLETRSGTGTRRAALAAGETRVLTVRGAAGLPSTGVRAVALAVSASGVSATSAVTFWASGTRPLPADLVTSVGRPWSTLVVVPVAKDGTVRLHNAAGWVHVSADVLGWYGG